MERIIQSLIRNLTVHMREMEALGIAMEATTSIHMEETDTSTMEGMDIRTIEEMATTIMATRITTTRTPREVMAITMEATMDKTSTTTPPRGTSGRCSVSHASRRDTIREIALRRRKTMGTSQIHSRRDM
jgi:hypothetical protein